MQIVLYRNLPATSEGNSVTPKQAKHHEVGTRSNLAVSLTCHCPTVTQAQKEDGVL